MFDISFFVRVLRVALGYLSPKFCQRRFKKYREGLKYGSLSGDNKTYNWNSPNGSYIVVCTDSI